MEESIRSQLWASQLRQYERETNVEPHARLLKVVIADIEAQQEDPCFHHNSLPGAPTHNLISLRCGEKFRLTMDCLAQYEFRESAKVESWTIRRVMERVEKKDKILLREVAAKAVQYLRMVISFSYTPRIPAEVEKLHRNLNCYSNVVSASEPGSQLAFAFNAAVVAVLHLLAFVFQYLIGYVDRGGSKTFSSGAFDFRPTFVSLVLFQGAYVWIKFRQATPSGSRKRKAPIHPAPDTTIDVQLAVGCDRTRVYERVRSTATGTYIKYEPRFSWRREEADGESKVRSDRLSLGEYHTRVEAMIVLQIARFYYDDIKDEGCLELQDGPYKFSIPPMSEQERGFTGEEKRKWVQDTAKQLGKQRYGDLQREKAKLKSDMAVEAGPHVGHGNGAGSSGPSSCALPLPYSSPAMLTMIADKPAIVSNAPSSPNLPLIPVAAGNVGDVDGSSGALSDSDGMIAELFSDREFPNHPAQPSNLDRYQTIYQEFARIIEVPSSTVTVTRSIEHVSEPEVRPDRNLQQGRSLVAVGSPNIDGRESIVFLQQSDPVLQQVGLCEKKLLEDTARQFADLNNRLTVSQRQISELQKEKESWQLEKEQLRTEIERYAKAGCERRPNFQVATWTEITMDIQQGD